MTDLKNTTALVKALLEQDEKCRNSDSLLYFRVLSVVAEKKGISLKLITIPEFLLNLHGKDFPIFESVRRARQKLQEHNPELAACEEVQDMRALNEEAYLEFVRSGYCG